MKHIFNFYQYSLLESVDPELTDIDELGDEHPMSVIDDIKNFIFAGKSIFTLKSLKSGTHYTYMMKNSDKKNEKQELFFVGLLRGPNNDSDYSYMGIVVKDTTNGLWKFISTAKSKVKPDAIGYIGFKYFLDQIVRDKMNPLMKFYHRNLCGRCGRTLTVPESVERGLGPFCASQTDKKGFNKKRPLSPEMQRRIDFDREEDERGKKTGYKGYPWNGGDPESLTNTE